jgi:hypothetical protein
MALPSVWIIPIFIGIQYGLSAALKALGIDLRLTEFGAGLIVFGAALTVTGLIVLVTGKNNKNIVMLLALTIYGLAYMSLYLIKPEGTWLNEGAVVLSVILAIAGSALVAHITGMELNA